MTVGESEVVVTAGGARIWSGPVSKLSAAGGPGGESWSSLMNVGLRWTRARVSNMEFGSRLVATSAEDGSADL